MVNRQRFRNVNWRAEFARGSHRGERFCDKARDVAEADSPVKKGRNRDFIGGVERGGRASARAQRLDREAKRRKTLEVGALEGQSAERRKVRRPSPRRDSIRILQAVRNRGAHV